MDEDRSASEGRLGSGGERYRPRAFPVDHAALLSLSKPSESDEAKSSDDHSSDSVESCGSSCLGSTKVVGSKTGASSQNGDRIKHGERGSSGVYI